MPDSADRIDRRKAIRTVVTRGLVAGLPVGLAILGINALRQTPQPPEAAVNVSVNPIASEPSDGNLWRPIDVPATEDVIRIGIDPSSQKPFIGLRELYVGSLADVPILMIAALWDRQTNKNRTSKYKLGGAPRFQPIEDPFKADESKFLPSGVQNQYINEAIMLGSVVYEEILKKNPNLDLDQDPHGGAAFSRPPSGTRYALVFEAESVEYNSRPSPTSYLNLAFKFEDVILRGKAI